MQNEQTRWLKYFDSDAIARLSKIGFSPSGLVEGKRVGNHRSPFHGFAIEFAGHRGYVPGDDVRHIDWKVYYRTGRYLMKQYEQETDLFCHVVVDVSDSMKFEWKHGSKKDYAAFIATALSQVITEQADNVNVQFCTDRVHGETGMTNSMDVIGSIAAFYEQDFKFGNGSLGEALRLLGESSGRRHIFFIISDFYDDPDDVFDGVKRLLGNRHEVVLVQLSDPLERTFDINGRIRFLDMESDESFTAVGTNLRTAYEELYREFLDNLRDRARSLGVDCLFCHTEKNLAVQFAEYLSAKAAMARGG